MNRAQTTTTPASTTANVAAGAIVSATVTGVLLAALGHDLGLGIPGFVVAAAVAATALLLRRAAGRAPATESTFDGVWQARSIGILLAFAAYVAAATATANVEARFPLYLGFVALTIVSWAGSIITDHADDRTATA